MFNIWKKIQPGNKNENKSNNENTSNNENKINNDAFDIFLNNMRDDMLKIKKEKKKENKKENKK